MAGSKKWTNFVLHPLIHTLPLEGSAQNVVLIR